MTDKGLIPYKPPTSVNEAMSVGQVLADSGFFQDSRGAAQAVAKILAGAELGFGPVASMTGVNIIKGRVTLSANLMAAAIKRHPRYTYRLREHSDTACVIDFVENGEVVGESSFSMEDAKAAGLANSENYRKYPRNMLFSRAISNGAKWYCPDVFGGSPVYSPDELGVEVDGATGEVIDSTAVEEPLESRPKPSSDISQPYVGDNDHAPENVDRGGRTRFVDDGSPQRPELVEAAKGLLLPAVQSCYEVAGLEPPSRKKDAFRGLDDVQAEALEAALKNRRFKDLYPSDLNYSAQDLAPALQGDVDADAESDLPWAKSPVVPLPVGSAPVDAELEFDAETVERAERIAREFSGTVEDDDA